MAEATQEMAALKPCPFCGHRTVGMARACDDGWWAECNKCGASRLPEKTEREAIAAWNTRLTAQSGEGRSGAGEDVPKLASDDRLREAMRDIEQRCPEAEDQGDCVDDDIAVEVELTWADLREIRAALNARQSGDDEEEKAYRIGKDEGYQDAVQEIDIATGGDGEFRFCLGGASERHCPDAETMKARILDRFAARQSGEGERGQ